MGGGIVLIIALALVVLPIAGVAFAFPFSDADENGNVSYRSTETLYYNEFWYEFEYIEKDNLITINRIQSTIAEINFGIDNRPFESIPTRSFLTIETGSKNLLNNEYEYLWFFLRPGSSIDYDFNTTGLVDFFIGDGNDLYLWDQGGSPSFYVDEQNTNGDSGSLAITSANDYYVVWYNEGGTTVDVDFTVNFTESGVPDFYQTSFHRNETKSILGETFSVPSSGNWYFFIYFDPMNSEAESTTITFDVTYDTGVTSRDRWLNIQWIFIIILVIVVIILIATVIARRGQKKLKLKEPEKTPAKGTKGSPYKKVPITELNCIRCGASLHSDSKFCPKCGGKVEGRQTVSSDVSTPANSKNCSLCGSKLTEKEKFCKWCGTKVES
jgi:flagellar basal body-associated protein FliL